MKSWCWWILIFNGFYYNQYFGWNVLPKSDAEMICDMLFGIMAILVFRNDYSVNADNEK